MMRESVSLGYALGLIPQGSLDATLNATPSFNHAFVSATVRYDTAALMDIFYKGPGIARRSARTQSWSRRDAMSCAGC